MNRKHVLNNLNDIMKYFKILASCFILFSIMLSCSDVDTIEFSNDIVISDGNNTVFVPKSEILKLYSSVDLNLDATIDGSYPWIYVTIEHIDNQNTVKITEWEYINKFADSKYVKQIYEDCIFEGRDDLGYAFKELNKNSTKEIRKCQMARRNI